MDIATLPAPLRSNPTMLKVMGQLSTTKARARELGKLEKLVQSPVEQVGASLAGGAAVGMMRAYFDPARAKMGAGAVGVAAIIYGSVSESPAAISFGASALAVLAADMVEDTLSRREVSEAA